MIISMIILGSIAGLYAMDRESEIIALKKENSELKRKLFVSEQEGIYKTQKIDKQNQVIGMQLAGVSRVTRTGDHYELKFLDGTKGYMSNDKYHEMLIIYDIRGVDALTMQELKDMCEELEKA